ALVGGEEIRGVCIAVIDVNAACQPSKVLLAMKGYTVGSGPCREPHAVGEVNRDPFFVGGVKFRVVMVRVYLLDQAAHVVVVTVGMTEPEAFPTARDLARRRRLFRSLA